jgi:hypothetical protein
MSHVVNPETGRLIKKDSPNYRKLVKLGVITNEGVPIRKQTKVEIPDLDGETEVSYTEQIPPQKKPKSIMIPKKTIPQKKQLTMPSMDRSFSNMKFENGNAEEYFESKNQSSESEESEDDFEDFLDKEFD